MVRLISRRDMAIDVTFAAASARYVRIYLTKNNNSSERINEVEVYAKAGATLSKASENDAAAAMIPEEISLAQNYPNPFNPSTKIFYSLPAGMHVTLNVVNLNGQEVAKLVDGYHARGVYEVKFDAFNFNLPSGIYFAVLKAGAITQVRRMVLGNSPCGRSQTASLGPLKHK